MIPEAEDPRPNLISLDLPMWEIIPNEELEKRDVILNNGYPLLGALVFGLSPE